jgi:hypothetical protein
MNATGNRFHFGKLRHGSILVDWSGLHFSRPDRRSVAPTSWSAVLAAPSPPEQRLVHLNSLHTP